jgi:hypothetical protein
VVLASLWLVYNLDRAIALGTRGAGPNGVRIAEYTFVVDFALTGAFPPLKTVKACMEVALWVVRLGGRLMGGEVARSSFGW